MSLFKAIASGRTGDVLKAISKNNDCINERIHSTGATPLMKAIQKSNYEAFEILDKISNVNDVDNTRRTALHDAAEKGQFRMCLELLLLNAKLDVQDIDGYSPLHEAAWEGHVKICQLLISHGINIFLEDSEGDTAYDIAVRSGLEKCIDLLEEEEKAQMKGIRSIEKYKKALKKDKMDRLKTSLTVSSLNLLSELKVQTKNNDKNVRNSASLDKVNKLATSPNFIPITFLKDSLSNVEPVKSSNDIPSFSKLYEKKIEYDGIVNFINGKMTVFDEIVQKSELIEQRYGNFKKSLNNSLKIQMEEEDIFLDFENIQNKIRTSAAHNVSPDEKLIEDRKQILEKVKVAIAERKSSLEKSKMQLESEKIFLEKTGKEIVEEVKTLILNLSEPEDILNPLSSVSNCKQDDVNKASEKSTQESTGDLKNHILLKIKELKSCMLKIDEKYIQTSNILGNMSRTMINPEELKKIEKLETEWKESFSSFHSLVECLKAQIKELLFDFGAMNRDSFLVSLKEEMTEKLLERIEEMKKHTERYNFMETSVKETDECLSRKNSFLEEFFIFYDKIFDLIDEIQMCKIKLEKYKRKERIIDIKKSEESIQSLKKSLECIQKSPKFLSSFFQGLKMSFVLPEIIFQFPVLNLIPIDKSVGCRNVGVLNQLSDYSSLPNLHNKKYSLKVFDVRKPIDYFVLKNLISLFTQINRSISSLQLKAVYRNRDCSKFYLEFPTYSKSFKFWLEEINDSYDEVESLEKKLKMFQKLVKLVSYHSNLGMSFQTLNLDNIFIAENEDSPLLTEFGFSMNGACLFSSFSKYYDEGLHERFCGFFSYVSKGSCNYEDEKCDIQNQLQNQTSDVKALGNVLLEMIEKKNLKLSPKVIYGKENFIPKKKALKLALEILDSQINDIPTCKDIIDSLSADNNEICLECMICLEDKNCSLGVTCDKLHFICDKCFCSYVKSQSMRGIAELEEHRGKIICPDPNCAYLYGNSIISRHCSGAIFDYYVKSHVHVEANDFLKGANMRGKSSSLKELLTFDQCIERKEKSILNLKSYILENIFTLKCPNPSCKKAFIDFAGCFAIKCSSCGHHFCGWCIHDLVDVKSAHSHVAICKYNLDPKKSVFSSNDLFMKAQRERKMRRLQKFLSKPKVSPFAQEVLKSLKSEIENL